MLSETGCTHAKLSLLQISGSATNSVVLLSLWPRYGRLDAPITMIGKPIVGPSAGYRTTGPLLLSSAVCRL